MHDIQLVRLRRGGRTVKVLTVPGMVLGYRQGKVPLPDVLLSEEVYDDVRKGRKTSKWDLQQLFNTADRLECCRAVVEQGEIQLSAAQRAAIAKEKWDQVAEHFDTNYVQTRPWVYNKPQDVKYAMGKVKVRVNAKSDVGGVIRKSRRAMQDQIRGTHVNHATRIVYVKCVDYRQRNLVSQHLSGRPVFWKVENYDMRMLKVTLYSAPAFGELKKQLHGWPVELSKFPCEDDDDNCDSWESLLVWRW